MAEFVNGPAGRVARVRAMMDERNYDAVVVRNEANMRWMTGAEGVFDYTFEYPHAVVITATDLYLHTDSRYFNSFIEAMGEDNPWKLDMDDIAIPTWIAARLVENNARVVAIEDTTELCVFNAIERAVQDMSGAVMFAQMHADIDRMRIAKDEQELETMRAAQAITDQTFTHMCEFIKVGMTEKEIRAELENYMMSHGADGLAFSSIVASGPNTANPHAIPSDRKVEAGDFVLMDFGARKNDYCSDMTRTVCMGEPSEQQREIYDTVRRAHETCAAAAHAGVNGADIHNMAVQVISEAGYGDYFAHGLGHGVGIEIHEIPRFSPAWNKEVPEGSVVTIEPGIYLPGVGGVRLEDYGVVTREGYKPFTTSTHELVILPL